MGEIFIHTNNQPINELSAPLKTNLNAVVEQSILPDHLPAAQGQQKKSSFRSTYVITYFINVSKFILISSNSHHLPIFPFT